MTSGRCAPATISISISTATIPFMTQFELGDAKIRSTPVYIDIAPLYSERAS